MRKRVPKFTSEDEEREFWATHDASDYVDWEDSQRIALSNLKPSQKRHQSLAERLEDETRGQR